MQKAAIINIERRNLAEQVFDYIKKMILSGQYKGGERIPEEKIAQELGVSRTPIREALRRLHEYGLIRIKPRSYAEVINVTRDEAEKIAQVRECLEILAVESLAGHASEKALKVLRKLNGECRAAIEADDLGTALEKDSQLHLEIAAQSGNAHLKELLEKLDAKVQLCRLAKSKEDMAQAVKEHEALFVAITQQDKRKAAELIKAHIWLAVNLGRKSDA